MDANQQKNRLSRKDLRAVATVSGLDERSVSAVLAGVRTRPETAQRVASALTSLGLAPVGVLDISPPLPTV